MDLSSLLLLILPSLTTAVQKSKSIDAFRIPRIRQKQEVGRYVIKRIKRLDETSKIQNQISMLRNSVKRKRLWAYTWEEAALKKANVNFQVRRYPRTRQNSSLRGWITANSPTGMHSSMFSSKSSWVARTDIRAAGGDLWKNVIWHSKLKTRAEH